MDRPGRHRGHTSGYVLSSRRLSQRVLPQEPKPTLLPGDYRAKGGQAAAAASGKAEAAGRLTSPGEVSKAVREERPDAGVVR